MQKWLEFINKVDRVYVISANPTKPRKMKGSLDLASDETLRLYTALLADYEKDVRPALQHDIPINVTFVFMLTQIIDVDERNQILTTNAWLHQYWTDYKLVWDPRKYGNLTRIHIPHERIWRPDVVLYNNADSQYTKSVMSTDVVVDYLGNVSWSAAAIFKSSCPLDVKHYPFDRQTCTLNYASWAYDGTKIDLLLNSERGDQSNYMMSTEWNLLRITAEKNSVIYSCCPDAPYPFVNIHISIERRPMFYVFNLILPCVLISGIALLGFYMPSDSGEKVTLGITSLLSTTVFLMLVAEGMPPTSEALPLIGLYYGVTIFLVALATAMTVLTLNVHHQGVHGGEVPRILQRIVFKYLARVLFVQIDPYHSITHHVRYVYQRDHLDSTRNSECFKRLQYKPSSPEIRIKQQYNSPTKPRIPLHNNLQKLRKVSFASAPLSQETKETPLTSSVPPMKRRGISVSSVDEEMLDDFESEFLRVLDLVHATIERNEMRVAERDRRDATQLEWQQVAMVLDRFLLIVFIMGTALSSFLILYQRDLIE
ncbi:Neurotransmitter-gated ion-channel transmembrane region [Trichostrongylus colubriformis]|uniref:Neurotransmitter-gated ion-channel transmembrane region n=1 Tax=Trichostrongylus colubriformis TaxID=6319 RepID=A0AAN8FFX4_TRICO